MTVFLPLALAALVVAQQPAGSRPPSIAVQPPSQTPSVLSPGHLKPVGPRDNPMPQLQGFNIVLLVGESQSSGASIEDVPPAARKALADMKEFLPFKHYRVLDSQWTSCCAESGRNTIAGRVQGVMASMSSAQGSPEMRLLPRTYNFILQASPSVSRLSVYFSLQPDDKARSGQNANLSAAREQELERRLSELRRELDTLEDEIPRRTNAQAKGNTPEIASLQAQRRHVQQRIADTTNQLAASRAHPDTDRGNARSLIDSNFTMDVGETVVVGTSRLGGDKALIAIVTAARKGSSSSR